MAPNKTQETTSPPKEVACAANVKEAPPVKISQKQESLPHPILAPPNAPAAPGAPAPSPAPSTAPKKTPAPPSTPKSQARPQSRPRKPRRSQTPIQAPKSKPMQTKPVILSAASKEEAPSPTCAKETGNKFQQSKPFNVMSSKQKSNHS